MDYLIEDCYLALAAILAVVFIVIITHGLLFSIVLVLGMLLSIGVAFFIYVVSFIEKNLKKNDFLDCATNSLLSVHKLACNFDFIRQGLYFF